MVVFEHFANSKIAVFLEEVDLFGRECGHKVPLWFGEYDEVVVVKGQARFFNGDIHVEV